MVHHGAIGRAAHDVISVCPLWARQRKELQAVAGDRWGDVSFLLGGWGKREDANSGKLLQGLTIMDGHPLVFC